MPGHFGIQSRQPHCPVQEEVLWGIKGQTPKTQCWAARLAQRFGPVRMSASSNRFLQLLFFHPKNEYRRSVKSEESSTRIVVGVTTSRCRMPAVVVGGQGSAGTLSAIHSSVDEPTTSVLVIVFTLVDKSSDVYQTPKNCAWQDVVMREDKKQIASYRWNDESFLSNSPRLLIF